MNKPARPSKTVTMDIDTRVTDAVLGMKYRDGSRVGVITGIGRDYLARKDRTRSLVVVKFKRGKETTIETFRHERVGYFTQVVDVPKEAMD